MATPQLIGPTLSRPSPGPSPSSSGGGFWRRPRRALPPDLLREASRRLGVMSLVSGVIWILATVAGHLAYHAVSPDDTGWAQLRLSDWVAAGAALVSLALFFHTRRANDKPEFVLDIGLTYMVSMAMALSLAVFSEARPPACPPSR